ncbi:MAG: BolA family transcriptional regulator [Ferrovum sp.]|nr:BolA family transcriptional regulator [Ferrovum sp.]NDU86957.1 BolA family transcriptional regulator [Ferrovum sp.]
MTSSTIGQIRRALAVFHPTTLHIEDDSHHHRGHAGSREGGGHYRILIEAETFRNRSRLECHRLVYEALGSLMVKEIHALQVQAHAPTTPVV